MKAALYARVSRADQQTIPHQLSEMREYCIRRGWDVTQEFHEQISGAKEKRPQRAELMNLVKRGRFNVVLVWKLDRWGRSAHDVMMTLAEVHSQGCAFVSITEGIDLTTPAGKMMAGFLAVYAEFELDQLKARTRAGLQIARSKGTRLGRRPHAQAYKGEILQWSSKGLKPAQIVKAMQGKVSETSVRRIIKDAH